MKKLIITLVLILIVIYAALAILGSGGEYAAEKLFYKAMKKASELAANPDVAPPLQLVLVERELKLLMSKYPNANITKFGHMGLLELYINNKRYDEAMDLAEVIKGKYSSDVGTLSTAQFAKGLIYEKQDKWDKALAEYNILKEKYPTTQLGIQSPLYIWKYYETKGLDSQAKDAYQNAIAFYTKMGKEYSSKMAGYTASILLIQTYLDIKDYESAGKTLEKTLHEYSSPMAFVQLLPLTQNIYIENLNNPKKAIEIYKYVMSKTKDPRLAKILKQKIKALESKETK